MPVNPSDHVTTLQRLKHEIQQLTDTQIAALERATYVPMTAQEEQDYDGRQRQIAELMNRVMVLQPSHLTKPQ